MCATGMLPWTIAATFLKLHFSNCIISPWSIPKAVFCMLVLSVRRDQQSHEKMLG